MPWNKSRGNEKKKKWHENANRLYEQGNTIHITMHEKSKSPYHKYKHDKQGTNEENITFHALVCALSNQLVKVPDLATRFA